MSLDIMLRASNTQNNQSSGIFIRRNGSTVEISEDEFRKLYPNQEPVRVISNEANFKTVYETNITHNLNEMADKADIYKAIWRPYMLHKDFIDNNESYSDEMLFEESVTMKAKEIIPFIEKGLTDMKHRPEYFRQFDASNGWGTYEQFIPFIEEYLNACKQYPEAIIEVDR